MPPETKPITDLIATLGFPIVITLWLLYRDYKWITNLIILKQKESDMISELLSRTRDLQDGQKEVRKGVEGLYNGDTKVPGH